MALGIILYYSQKKNVIYVIRHYVVLHNLLSFVLKGSCQRVHYYSSRKDSHNVLVDICTQTALRLCFRCQKGSLLSLFRGPYALAYERWYYQPLFSGGQIDSVSNALHALNRVTNYNFPIYSTLAFHGLFCVVTDIFCFVGQKAYMHDLKHSYKITKAKVLSERVGEKQIFLRVEQSLIRLLVTAHRGR